MASALETRVVPPGMRVVGVDENGLGPRLGPLVATAATLRVRSYDLERASTIGDALGVGDSKKTSGFGKMATAEGLTLALAEQETGQLPRDLDGLLAALSLDGVLPLRAPCPDAGTQAQCWGPEVTLPAFGGDVATGREQLRGLKKAGIRVSRVRTTFACAGVLNDAYRSGRNKLQVDLALFERLVLDARRAGRGEVHAICGMVGGIRSYEEYFTHFERAEALASESKREIPYKVEGVGEVRFEVKADDRHLPVGIASMVGKVIRELTMLRIVRYYQGHVPDLVGASGYHDPVSKRFVDRTVDTRKRLRIVDSCFER